MTRGKAYKILLFLVYWMVILHTEDFMKQKFALMINVYNHDGFQIARDMNKCHLNLNKKCLYTLRENIPPLKPPFFQTFKFYIVRRTYDYMYEYDWQSFFTYFLQFTISFYIVVTVTVTVTIRHYIVLTTNLLM